MSNKNRLNTGKHSSVCISLLLAILIVVAPINQ
jgi:hypothetical protein